MSQSLNYFNFVKEKFFETQLSKQKSVRLYYRIAGYRICLMFANQTLVSLLSPAFAHLQEDSSQQVDLTIYLWDSESTGIQLPAPPWDMAAYGKRGEIDGYNDERIKTIYKLGHCAMSLVDLQENEAIYWTPSIEKLACWEIGSPLIAILNTWMSAHQRYYIHGGVVGRDGIGVLLTGKGGSGKSSTALSCVRAGLDYLSDDYTLVEEGNHHVIAHSIYNSAKLDDNGLIYFPKLLKHIHNTVKRHRLEKSRVYLHEIYPEKMCSSMHIKAILLPRITDVGEMTKTSLTPVEPIAALWALAPSTILQLANSGQQSFSLMARITKRVPCYYLNLGKNRGEIPCIISNLLVQSKNCAPN